MPEPPSSQPGTDDVRKEDVPVSAFERQVSCSLICLYNSLLQQLSRIISAIGTFAIFYIDVCVFEGSRYPLLILYRCILLYAYRSLESTPTPDDRKAVCWVVAQDFVFLVWLSAVSGDVPN